MKAAQQHLTYKRHDGAIGVGYFMPWAGRYVHSVAWPDLPAERYSVERLERMGVQVLGIETVGKEPPEPSPTTAEGRETSGIPEPDGLPQIPDIESDLPTSDDENEKPPTDNRPVSNTTPVSEAEAIREFLQTSPEASNKEVVAKLKERGIEVSSSQVSRERRRG